jgi:hypothetical protein
VYGHDPTWSVLEHSFKTNLLCRRQVLEERLDLPLRKTFKQVYVGAEPCPSSLWLQLPSLPVLSLESSF